MAFKPNRKNPDDIDLDNLRGILNQTNTSSRNNPLYQFCNSLLDLLARGFAKLLERIKALEDGTSSKSSKTTITNADYVVLSDGATPIPSPVDDGFGNFIYVEYEP